MKMPPRPSKRGLEASLKAVADTHKGKRITLWFQDEARIGQKGRVCHRWYRKGQRPPGLADKRFTFAYIFALRLGDAERQQGHHAALSR